MSPRRSLALTSVLLLAIIAASLLLVRPWESGAKDNAPPAAASNASPTAAATPLIPSAADVTYVELGFGGPFSPQVPLPLEPGRPAEAAAISRLLAWLAEGRAVETTSEYIDVGVAAVIHTSGSFVSVLEAWDCTHTLNSTSCFPVPDEVIVAPQHGDAIHLRSAELATWLHERGSGDFRLGSPEEARAAGAR